MASLLNLALEVGGVLCELKERRGTIQRMMRNEKTLPAQNRVRRSVRVRDYELRMTGAVVYVGWFRFC